MATNCKLKMETELDLQQNKYKNKDRGWDNECLMEMEVRTKNAT